MKNLKIVNKEELKDWAKEIFKKNSFNMVDVSKKKETFRRALSCGKIFVGKEVYDLIKSNNMPKGDPISLAEISAVLGVKKTSELIPLCHPLPIDHTATKIVMNEVDHSLEVYCVVSAFAKTGVEMESIMGVNAALITIYDLSKIINPNLKIDNVKLLIKEGGKSGLWTNPNGLPEFLKKNSFNMVDVSSKKETFRRALASGKIYVGKEVFDLIKNKKMPKGDPVTLAEVSAVLGVKKNK